MVYKSLEHHLDCQRKEFVAVVDKIVRDAVETSEDGTFDITFEDIPCDLNMLEDKYLITEMLAERSEVIEAEAQIPLAMAEAFRNGRLGVMDYYKMRNVMADTQMRESLGGGSSDPTKK